MARPTVAISRQTRAISPRTSNTTRSCCAGSQGSHGVRLRAAAYERAIPQHGLQSAGVICHEDLDTIAAPHVVPFVATALAQSRKRYSKSIGEARLDGGQRDRVMCRSKSRGGCHFAAAIGLRSLLENYAPTTGLGQRSAQDRRSQLGRGLEHFRKEGVKLIPPSTGPDPYIEEAYRLWVLKQRRSK
ncbi:hypothetical protein GA0061098_10647 [Bradyrhizobium shewense]|uniref:Uncharacterized protein n=1 Tax=Bradyrhizobium shewense TaxID=1761772 RepID=A0A1C3XUQ3_9BRAD|nr:hypothetical protein GA0061098_10647 [Bradyrhizobium shewense]